jgi:hypothetical protein
MTGRRAPGPGGLLSTVPLCPSSPSVSPQPEPSHMAPAKCMPFDARLAQLPVKHCFS